MQKPGCERIAAGGPTPQTEMEKKASMNGFLHIRAAAGDGRHDEVTLDADHRRHCLFVSTASGEVKALERKDRGVIDELATGLTDAIVMSQR
jgi:hypothetical protein